MSYNLFLLAFVLGIGGAFQYGLQVSIINSPAEYIKNFIRETWLKRYGSSPTEELITLMWSFIVSIYSIGGLLGSLSAGYLSVRFGRKKAMLFANIPALLSAALMGLSRLCGSFEMIIAGRIFSGSFVTAGLGLNIHLMYAGECAPRKLRGLIAITASTAIAMGKFVGFVLGLREVLGVDALWPILMAANTLPALIQLLTLPFFPDSPRYLLIDKKDKEGCIKGEEMRNESQSIHFILKRDTCKHDHMGATFTYFYSFQVYSYAYNVFIAAGIPPTQTHYVSLGIGITEILSTVLCVSGSSAEFNSAVMHVSFPSLESTSNEASGIKLLQINSTGVLCPLPTEIFIQSYRPAAYVFNGFTNWIQLFILGLVFPFIVVSKAGCFVLVVSRPKERPCWRSWRSSTA
uniref:Major facilitator superfamily (MFS) profile domain-containing protein n=1 Tax=Calidris pygmaea TaxID=425635 RepID=A0A8C3KCZ1_9CHAR